MSVYGDGGTGGASAPAGWYPVDGETQRYWDGARWTDHVAPAPGPTPWHPGGGEAPGPAPFGQPQVPLPPPGQAGQSAYGQWPAGQPFAGQPNQGYGQAGTPPPFAADGSSPYQPVTAAGRPWIASTSDDRTMAVLIHVLGLVSGFIGPLVLWLVKREESAFIDHHGKQALNFHISLMIYWFVSFFLILLLVGILLIPVLFLLQILMPILAALAANRGETYKYSLSISFFS